MIPAYRLGPRRYWGFAGNYAGRPCNGMNRVLSRYSEFYIESRHIG